MRLRLREIWDTDVNPALAIDTFKHDLILVDAVLEAVKGAK